MQLLPLLLRLLFAITNTHAGTVRSSLEQTRLSEAATQCGAGEGVTRLLLPILLQQQALLPLLSKGSAARAASAAASAVAAPAAAAAAAAVVTAVAAAIAAAAAAVAAVAVTAVVRGWSCLQKSYFRVMLYH
jgi:hypothetical protein